MIDLSRKGLTAALKFHTDEKNEVVVTIKREGVYPERFKMRSTEAVGMCWRLLVCTFRSFYLRLR